MRPDATREDVRRFAETAVRPGTATLTVQPHYVHFGAELLRGRSVLLGTVVGFPHGNETPAMKEYQAREVLELGAGEIDMVMSIPALKNGEQALFMRDIVGVVIAAGGRTVKVITQNCLLAPDEKRRACDWIAQAGARCVKTSTACADGGAVRELEELPDDARVEFREFLTIPASPAALT